MILFKKYLNFVVGSSCFRLLAFLFCLATAGRLAAQTSALPSQAGAANATNSLMVAVEVWSPLAPRPGSPTPPGGWSNDRKTFTVPCDLHIMANVAVTPVPHEGDTVMIDFFANSEKLGSRKSVWLPELNPSAHRHGNEAVPMFIRPAQFSMEALVWTNVPAGHYSLTAKATFGSSPPAVSGPVGVTILSQPSSETNGQP